MNKPMFIGAGIFLVIVIALLNFSMTMDVNAQIILNNDTNVTPSMISYMLNISELNLTNSYQSIYDNLTDTTTIINITRALDYACVLRFDGTDYEYNASTSNLDEIVIINIPLSAVTEGYHTGVLGCMYYVNTTNTTDDGLTNTTTMLYTAVNITTQKTFLIDTTAPIVSLSNTTSFDLRNFANGIIYLNFTLTDVSEMNCTLNLNNVTGNSTIFANNFIANTSNMSIPLSLQVGNYTYTISCKDKWNNNNLVSSQIYVYNSSSTEIISETPFLNLEVSQPVFGLGEMGQYRITANNNSNVSITICPIASGWVQCYMTPPFVNDTFPKIQTLPYTNKTGRYIIEGVMRYKNYTLVKNVTYETANTLTATITPSRSTVAVNEIITFNATAALGIGAYTYRWTMHDGAKFTGPGAYRNYTSAGTFRVNLTVNDSVGNNYSTYTDVTIKNKYTLTVIVRNSKDSVRLSGAEVNADSYESTTDSSGTSTFRLIDGNYDLSVFKENYGSYSAKVNLDSDMTIYVNLTFQDSTPPTVTLLTANDIIMTPDAVDLKFKAQDISNVACSLYVAGNNDSWYTLKDSGDNLLVNTEYTFELRDLNNGAYKWKIECIDADKNKAYSEERKFIVSDGEVSIALQSSVQSSDDINLALDNLDKLSGDESAVADILNIRPELQDLLERITRIDRDMHDLAYRRDLDEKGRQEAQNNLTKTIDFLKYNTPVNIRITDSKTFVKYVRDEDLKILLDEYTSIKNLKIDKKMFLESTKSVQSKVIISTRVRNVELYYMDGRIEEITLVTKDIQAAVPEDAPLIRNSNSITFVEVVPKSISPTAKNLNMLSKDFTVIKDDPLLEFPADTESIIYYINGTIRLDAFQDSDTVLIEKNINVAKSMTGFSILGISSFSDINIEGQGIMIIIIVILILFYLVVNFDIIEKIRNLNIGFIGPGSKKKVSFIKVLVNDALDYLKTEDYDKASLIYREIKLSYEGANDYVRKQVYDESFDLCNQLDLDYAMKVLDRAEYYIHTNDRNNAMIEFEKLENTYNKLSSTYQTKIDVRFRRLLELIKSRT